VSDSFEDRKTITVYCAAESHQLWERSYHRREENPWMPDPFDIVGGDFRKSRRDGGVEFIDAAGRAIRSWDCGRRSAEHPLGEIERFMSDLDAARKVAGGDDAQFRLGRRYRLRCPLCGDEVRCSDSTANKHFNSLWQQGITRISLNGFRGLDRLR
jgi:hypothetical protein